MAKKTKSKKGSKGHPKKKKGAHRKGTHKKKKGAHRKGKHVKRGCGKHNWRKGGNALWKCKKGKKHPYK